MAFAEIYKLKQITMKHFITMLNSSNIYFNAGNFQNMGQTDK